MDGKNKPGRKWDSPSECFCFSPIQKTDRCPIVEKAYQALRKAILFGNIKPENWLRIDLISSQMGISQTPVREAMNILRKEDLVEVVPNYGFKVAGLSYEKFEEIYAIRIGIEQLAAQRSMHAMSDENLVELKNAFIKLGTYRNKPLNDYLQFEWSFRVLFYSIGSSAIFISQIQEFRDQAERYLRLAYRSAASINDSFHLHEILIHACLNMNEKNAVEAITDALQWTLKTAGPVIKNQLGAIE